MGLKDELQKEVKDIFAVQWQIRDGKKVPETEDLKLGNDAIKITATVLYADLAESTSLVDNQKWWAFDTNNRTASTVGNGLTVR